MKHKMRGMMMIIGKAPIDSAETMKLLPLQGEVGWG